MKKVAVQPFLQYKQLETKESIEKLSDLKKKKKKKKKKDYEGLMEECSDRKP